MPLSPSFFTAAVNFCFCSECHDAFPKVFFFRLGNGDGLPPPPPRPGLSPLWLTAPTGRNCCPLAPRPSTRPSGPWSRSSTSPSAPGTRAFLPGGAHSRKSGGKQGGGVGGNIVEWAFLKPNPSPRPNGLSLKCLKPMFQTRLTPSRHRQCTDGGGFPDEMR